MFAAIKRLFQPAGEPAPPPSLLSKYAGNYWVEDAFDTCLSFGHSIAHIRGSRSGNYSGTAKRLTHKQLADATVLGVLHGEYTDRPGVNQSPMFDTRDAKTKRYDDAEIAVIKAAK